jgi:hypothetical protein
MKNLSDVHSEFNIELESFAHLFMKRVYDEFCISYVVHSRAIAGSEKFIRHVFANYCVITATVFKQKHSRCNFTIAKERRSGHGVIKVSVRSFKW